MIQRIALRNRFEFIFLENLISVTKLRFRRYFLRTPRVKGASAPPADEEGHELFLSDIEDMLEAASLDDKQQPCKTAADAAAAAEAADAAAAAAAAAVAAAEADAADTAADAAAAVAVADATTAEADAAVATAEAAAPKESHFYHLWSAPVGEVALLLAELQAQAPLMDVRDYWHHGGSSPGCGAEERPYSVERSLSAPNRAIWCDCDLRFEYRESITSDLRGSALRFCSNLEKVSNHKSRDLNCDAIEAFSTAIWGIFLRFGLRDLKSLAICDL